MARKLFNDGYHRRKDKEACDWLDDRFGWIKKFFPEDIEGTSPIILFLIFVLLLPFMLLDFAMYGDD